MIEQYLQSLRSALAGADPAITQDALYDAEEHLRAEFAECAEADLACHAAVIDRYGTPEEVAAAYLETEVTVAKALGAPKVAGQRGLLARFFGVVADPRAYGALFYLSLSLITGVLYFTLVMSLLPAGIGTLPVGVGLLILLLFIAIVRAVSLAEGRLIEAMLGVRMPRRPRGSFSQGDVLSRVKQWLTDSKTWTSILYMVLQLPLGVIYFTAITIAMATSVSIAMVPVAQLITDYPVIQFGGYGYIIEPWGAPFMMAFGLLGFIVTLHVCRAVGQLHGRYAKALLVGRASDAGAV